ncbi:hypothetical protein V2J09_021566, partial [Rumex salicifolius]
VVCRRSLESVAGLPAYAIVVTINIFRGITSEEEELEFKNASLDDQSFQLSQEDEEPKIYVHAITGSSPLMTIKIKGTVAGRGIMILIDSGAAHTFIDPRVLKELGIESHPTSIMEAAVANGHKLYSHQVCKKFQWEGFSKPDSTRGC